jgi:hypothetical protein
MTAPTATIFLSMRIDFHGKSRDDPGDSLPV